MTQPGAADGGAKVLIVEDETIVAFFLVDLIEDLGFTVIGPAGHGEEALALAERERPDIAVVDVSLAADHDGVEVGAELARRFGTQLVFMSGHGDVADRPDVQRLAPSAVLRKPCLPNQIEEALRLAAAGRASD